MRTRRSQAAAATAGWALLASALHQLRNAGDLGGPSAWERIDSWYELVGPATATMSLVRLVAMAASAWLALATGLQLAASVRPTRALRITADAVSPRWLRNMGRSMAGISLSAGLALPAWAPALPTMERPALALQQDDGSAEGYGVAVMQPLPATDEVAQPPAPAPPPAELRQVEPGESCWSIAEEVLRERSAEPSESEVRAYWLRLIEANRSRFVTGDPDLLFPGQELELPAIA